MAFAVAGTGLKTNGPCSGKQSGTKGCPARKVVVVEEVGLKREKKAAKNTENYLEAA